MSCNWQKQLPKITYPIYILEGKTAGEPCPEDQIIFPENKEDMGHVDFWEQKVHKIIADYYKMPPQRLFNLPYCIQRARVVDDIVYYGEKQTKKLLQQIRKAVGNKALVFAFDEHERRLKVEARKLRKSKEVL